MYVPNKCNESVTGKAWTSRALDTVIGRAKTQIKGKFLFAVAILSFMRLGDHQATDRSLNYSLDMYIYNYIHHISIIHISKLTNIYT